MITKEQKKKIISKLSDIFKSAKSVVFTKFHGLNVAEMTEMRKALRAEKTSFLISRKTLIRRALEDSKISGEIPALEGEIALAYGNDLTTPANKVFEFQKKLDDKISIEGGIFEGKFMDKIAMMEIALIPPMPILRGMFVNIINSPIQRFVIVLNAMAEKKG